MLTEIVTVITVITAVIHIRAEYKGPAIQKYIFKPATTSLIILIALYLTLSGKGDVTLLYQALIIAGLLFSLAGDIFLMLPSDRFIAGLVSFLIAHLLYIAAFIVDAGLTTSLGWLLPFLLYGGIIYRFLVPHVGKMKVPVIIYMVAILVMAWQAAGRWAADGQTGTLLAFAGALLFVVSDSVLALNRFRQPFKSARVLTMATYYSAQWLIALSVGSY